MPKPTKGPRLGGSAAHERMMLANLAGALFEHGGITTTETRAKRVQPLAERLISKARRGDLHNRRQVARVIRDKEILHILFTDVVSQIDAERDGGYTRIIKLGQRRGDAAPLARIELVTEKVVKKAKVSAPKAEEPKVEEPQAEEPQEEQEAPEAEEAPEATEED